jgi:hypothetical protein
MNLIWARSSNLDRYTSGASRMHRKPFRCHFCLCSGTKHERRSFILTASSGSNWRFQEIIAREKIGASIKSNYRYYTEGIGFPATLFFFPNSFSYRPCLFFPSKRHCPPCLHRLFRVSVSIRSFLFRCLETLLIFIGRLCRCILIN